MPYEKLLENRIIEPVEVSDEEIAGRLRAASRDIEVAQSVAGLDLDWAFTIAYNGILQTALAFMYSKGFRPRGEGKHFNTFRFLKEALPEAFEKEISLMQKLRKKRNQAVYQSKGMVSEKEAQNIIKFSLDFLNEIMGLLPEGITKIAKEL